MHTLVDQPTFIYIQHQKILCLKVWGSLVYQLPGGKRREGESDVQTLSREMTASFGVQIIPGTIEYIGTFEAPAMDGVDGSILRLTCYEGEYTGELKKSRDIADIAWLGYADRNRVSPSAQILFDFLKERDMLA